MLEHFLSRFAHRPVLECDDKLSPPRQGLTQVMRSLYLQGRAAEIQPAKRDQDSDRRAWRKTLDKLLDRWGSPKA